MVAFLIITWILAGLLAVVIACMADLRGKPYNEEFFSKYIKDHFLFMIYFCILGYIALILVIAFCLYDMYESKKYKILGVMSKLLYKVVNVGTKKN